MSRNEDMVIRFSGLKSGVYDYDFTMDEVFFAEQGNDEIRSGNVSVRVKMEKREHLLAFTFGLDGEIVTWCDRCLGDLPVKVSGEERLYVRFSDTEQSDEEDLVILPEDAFEIDLTQWMYEYVAVRIPLRHVHEEGQCSEEMLKYLTDPGEGETEAVDPRWMKLGELLEEKEEEKQERNK